ncbi:MAG: hypothetical protein Q8N05_16545 [Bacteroidota bacterium]|nr:hypothetical protein [Bacteroidota bacterium]
MNSNNQETSAEMNFNERYSTFTDVQILEILKNHKNYQETAVDAAVKIAVERQLIHSKQDLLAPEFQTSPTSGFTIFPEITSDYHRQRLVESIFRFMYVISFLPFIYGFLKYGEGQIDQTFWGVGIGTIWLLLCVWLKRTQMQILFIPLFGLLFLQGVLAGVKIFSPETFRVLDLVMLIIGFLLPAYFLIYLKKLIRQNSPDIQ